MIIRNLSTRNKYFLATSLVLIFILFGIKINNRMKLNAEIEAENKIKIAELTKQENARLSKESMNDEWRKIDAEKRKKKAHILNAIDWGDSWPFDPLTLEIDCVNYRDVIIRHNEKVYALNGKAMQRFPEPKPILRKHPIPTEMIQKGLAFCPK